MKNTKSSRRSFISASGALAGGGWLALNAPMLLAAGHAAAKHKSTEKGWSNISAQQARTFAAVVDQIIPPDESPGASDAGVVYFIDNVLGGFMADAEGLLKKGLEELDRQAAASSPARPDFASLSFDQQTELLQMIESTEFFNTMIFLTHCGMFAMPSWGGNRDLVGWSLVGFDNRHAWQPPFGYYDALAVAGEADHVDG